jgi:DNA-binding transcriptional LysR family regulator
MTTDQLQLFLEIVRQRSLARAAIELDLSQATVSDRLKSLETELGARLFERHGRGMSLTPAGQAFRPHAERSLDVLRQARESVKAASSGQAGQVTVAVTVTAGAYLFAPALVAFQRQYPQVEVRVRSVHSWDAPGLLFDGLAHLALVSGPVLHPQIETLASAQAPLVLVASQKHPRAKQTFTLSQLAGEQMLTTFWGASSQAFLERIRAAGPTGLWLELSPVELVKGLLLAGNGISLVPEIAVRRELASGDLVRLKLADSTMRLPMWEVTLICYSRVVPSPAAKSLTATLKEMLKGL